MPCLPRTGIATLVAVPLSVLLAVSAAAANTLGRTADPLILAGDAVPSLLGIAPNEVVAFRYDGAWQQIPVQVDERGLVDWGVIYDTTPIGLEVLVYTDEGTFTGSDADPLLDAADEIVVMLRDAGSFAPLFSEPVGVVAESGVELTADDPLDDGLGVVYLFRQDGTLDPGAGRSYVTYDFGLLSGEYLATYDVNNGPNPEDSRIVSARRSRRTGNGFRGRTVCRRPSSDRCFPTATG
jgi:hypothetical protein